MDESTISLSNSMSSSQPRQLIESNYKLALKFFMNKNFSKSYEIIKKLYKSSFGQFASDIINEKLFIKILNLYLTEIGLFIDKDNKDTNFNLERNERQEVITTLAQDQILDELYKVYSDDINAIPSEILYNLFLIYYINRTLITNAGNLKLKFDKLYYQFDYNSRLEDAYLKKLIDLYVFQVLLDNENFDEASVIISENPIYLSQIEESLSRLSTIRIDKAKKQKEAENKEKEKQEKLKEKKKRELQNQKELKDRQNLTYKSLNQIKQSSAKFDSKKDNKPIRATNGGYDIALVRQKLLYTLNLSKNYIKTNSPSILLIILLLFISSRFIKARRINVMERLKLTLQMAFKISYL
ncbi:uncharacterized protein AC631_05116 [Debaryomyces fabryi]|uniref:Uncharacterized protein n=1 Tax=Debaryomyces fabryi TaxID=58627 RepID=A0A0V1PSB1_9ASCO|nr:uncharacterized protein AC631_05116 [Debaryomyces fabryi]KRZ99123.1 hypothetical protein AC631_05116 [Debaryomyces fabryi]CUM45563.1 unnamed protein product [Debaryomyces fabryi]